MPGGNVGEGGVGTFGVPYRPSSAEKSEVDEIDVHG
jgi:hypothetical protein